MAPHKEPLEVDCGQCRAANDEAGCHIFDGLMLFKQEFKRT